MLRCVIWRSPLTTPPDDEQNGDLVHQAEGRQRIDDVAESGVLHHYRAQPTDEMRGARHAEGNIFPNCRYVEKRRFLLDGAERGLERGVRDPRSEGHPTLPERLEKGVGVHYGTTLTATSDDSDGTISCSAIATS